MVILSNAFSLNMLPETAKDITIRIQKIDIEKAKDLLKDGFASIVGHPDVARILVSMLKIAIPVNRATFTWTDDIPILVAQYRGARLPAGATELPKGAKIDFYLVTKEGEDE